MRAYHLGLCKTAAAPAMGIFCSQAPLTVALVCEKFERFAEGLLWAEAATSDDCCNLGSNNFYIHADGHRVKGRCLARLGQGVEATVAFDAAIKIGSENGLYLHELLALAKLASLGLGGDRAVLLKRMKAAAVKMIGEAPTAERLASLSKAKLPAGVTLGEIMAAV